jgi:hypothetical protein
MEDDTVERAYALRARCLEKDLYGLEQVRYFLRGLLETHSGEPDPVLTAARAWCARFDFTDAETKVFIHRTQGLTQLEIALALLQETFPFGPKHETRGAWPTSWILRESVV